MSNEFKVAVKLHADASQYTAEYAHAGQVHQAFTAQVVAGSTKASVGMQAAAAQAQQLGTATSAAANTASVALDGITSAAQTAGSVLQSAGVQASAGLQATAAQAEKLGTTTSAAASVASAGLGSVITAAQSTGAALQNASAQASSGLQATASHAQKLGATTSAAASAAETGLDSVATAAQATGNALQNAGAQGARGLGGMATTARDLQAGLQQTGTAAILAASSLASADDQVKKVGISAGQTAAAMRMLPAQVTDVVTSIAGGMPIWLIAIQQGGQIKDSFGGIAPMLRTLTGAITPAVAGFAALAAIGGTLAVAYYQGSAEADRYRKAIVMSGNAAGVSVGQLADMARAVSTNIGTQNEASRVLAEMAGSGRVAGDSLQRFSEVAIGLEKYVGQSVQTTVQHLSELGKAPLEASVKLNEQYNYLTPAVYRQIKALVEQGREEEAAAAAQSGYAAAFEARKNQMVANLGYLERAWNGLGAAAKWTWDQILNVGRDTTDQQNLDQLKQNLTRLEERNASLGIKGGAQTENLRNEVRLLEEKVAAQTKGAEAQSQAAAATQATVDWERMVEQYASKGAKKKQELATAQQRYNEALKAAGNDAQLRNQVEQQYDKVVASINEKFKERKTSTASVKQEQNAYEQLTATIRAKIEIDRAELDGNGALTESQRLRIKLDADLKAGKLQLTETHEASVRADLDALAAGEQALKRKEAELRVDAERIEIARELAAAAVAESIAREAGSLAVTRYVASVEESNAAMRYEVSLMGLSSREKETLLEQYRIELQLKREIEAVNRNAGFDEPQREAERVRLTQAAVAAMGAAATRVQLQQWQESVQQYDQVFRQGFASMLNHGEGKWKAFTKSLGTTFKTTVADALYKAFAQPFVVPVVATVQGLINGVLGGTGSSQAAGEGGVGSAVGMLSSLQTAYSTLTGGLTSSLASGIGGLGKMLGSQAAQSFAAGMKAATLGQSTAAASGATAAGASAASVIPVVGWIAAGMSASKGAYEQGYTEKDLNWLNPIGTVEKSVTRLLTAVGISEKAAHILSGASLTAKIVTSVFGGKVTTNDGGIDGQLGGDLRSYVEMKKSGGWFSSNKYWTNQGGVIDGNAQVQATFALLKDGVSQQADVLGLSADAVSKYTRSIRFSTQGLTGDQVVARLEEEITAAGDAMAALALGTTQYTRTGESATAALLRLSGNLSVTNASLDTMGNKLFSVGLSGADMASSLVDRFGSLDSYISASEAYYKAYYSQAERANASTATMTKQLAELGLTLPVTHEGFRQLVSGLDLTTDRGREAYATLLAMAPQFDETARILDELAKAAAADLISTYTRAAAVAPGMQIAREAMSSATSQAQALGGSVSSINKILGDANSGVLTFGGTIDKTGAAGVTAATHLTSAQKAVLGLSDTSKATVGDLTAAQKGLLGIGTASGTSATQLTAAQQAVLVLRGEIYSLQTAASGTVLNIDGLAKALQGVDTRTWAATITGAFELIAQRVRDDLSSIASERQAVREAAISIISPRVMTPEQIRAQIAVQTVSLPGHSSIASAQSALAKADSTAKAREQALLTAQAANTDKQAAAAAATAKVGVDRDGWARKLVATYLAHGNIQSGVSGEVVPSSLAGYATWSDTRGNMVSKIAGVSSAEVQAFADQLLGLGTAGMDWNKSTTSSYSTVLGHYKDSIDADAAKQARAQSLREQAAAQAVKVTAAEQALAAARAAQTAAAGGAQKAQLDYVAALQKYSLDSGKAVSNLSKLREETVAYYQSQAQLAQTMGASASSLRQTVADVRFSQLDTTAQFASLQERYNVAYSMAMVTTGETLAGYGTEMNSLLNPLLQKAQESGLSGAAYSSLVNTLLARAEAIAGRIDKEAPQSYEQESLGLLGQIDSTLAALEAGAKSSDQILTEAIKAGTDVNRDGLRAVIAALQGKQVPAFALGGMHSGGLRLVGERGPELEVTGPARYFSADQTQRMLSSSAPGSGFDLGPLLRELQELRLEVAQLRAERRADGGAIATNTGRTSRLLDRIVDDGIGVRNAVGERLAISQESA